MNIGFFSRGLNYRGTAVAVFDYAIYNELLLKRISKPKIKLNESNLLLCNNALNQFDIITSNESKIKQFGIIDIYNKYLITAPGKRLFLQWLNIPENNPDILKDLEKNKQRKKIEWTFTKQKADKKLGKYYTE